MIGHSRKCLLIGALAFIAGCASVDFDYPKPESQAFPDTSDTYYGRLLAGRAASHPDESGFWVMSDGIEALAARLVMAHRAERSIDAQYYLVKNDIVGREFVRVLLEAADRGVRVRLLLDDMFTPGYDIGLAALDSHPNFEVRIFNPFASRTLRVWDGVTKFRRINRRMHNKSFTVDNQVTMVGGRNIADEYFGAREDAKFGDLDVVGVGPVVADVSTMFDEYWNHERAAPIPAFANMPDDPAAALVELRRMLDESRAAVIDSKYADAVRQKVLAIDQPKSGVLTWAPYELVVDSPDKSFESKAPEARSITTPLRESLLRAEREVIVVSPYFVPRKVGTETLIAIHDRGVDVTVITNSLAANNQATVHGGYAPSRKPLLSHGIKLYEVRADADIPGAQIVAASGAKATLHTKAFVVDRREVFIGSFNFDPRSANINTELGVIIHSAEIGEAMFARINTALPLQTYEVYLNDKNRIRWRAREDGEEVVYDKEPQTSWGQRFMAGFFRILPIRGQL